MPDIKSKHFVRGARPHQGCSCLFGVQDSRTQIYTSDFVSIIRDTPEERIAVADLQLICGDPNMKLYESTLTWTCIWNTCMYTTA